MALKAAFIFVAPEADPAQHRTLIETAQVTLATIGVKDYQAAAQVAQELVRDGFVAIELCGGFGIEGTALVKRAVNGKAAAVELLDHLIHSIYFCRHFAHVGDGVLGEAAGVSGILIGESGELGAVAGMFAHFMRAGGQLADGGGNLGGHPLLLAGRVFGLGRDLTDLVRLLIELVGRPFHLLQTVAESLHHVIDGAGHLAQFIPAVIDQGEGEVALFGHPDHGELQLAQGVFHVAL